MKQQKKRLCVAQLARNMHNIVALSRPLIEIGTSLDEQEGHAVVLASNGPHQRRLFQQTTTHVDICTSIEKQRGHFAPVV